MVWKLIQLQLLAEAEWDRESPFVTVESRLEDDFD